MSRGVFRRASLRCEDLILAHIRSGLCPDPNPAFGGRQTPKAADPSVNRVSTLLAHVHAEPSERSAPRGYALPNLVGLGAKQP